MHVKPPRAFRWLELDLQPIKAQGAAKRRGIIFSELRRLLQLLTHGQIYHIQIARKGGHGRYVLSNKDMVGL